MFLKPNFIFLKKVLYDQIRILSYQKRKSINRSEVAHKTGINKIRLSELANNEITKLRVEELYLIALAIEADPCEVLREVCQDLKLTEPSEK